MDDVTAPWPLAACDPTFHFYGDRYELHLLPPGEEMPPLKDLRFGVDASGTSAHVSDPQASVEVGISHLNLSAWYIQRQRYPDAIDAVTAATEHLRAYYTNIDRAFGWADIRHAAAFYNAAVAYWWGDMSDAVVDMLERADLWLERVEETRHQDPAWVNVTSAISALRRRSA